MKFQKAAVSLLPPLSKSMQVMCQASYDDVYLEISVAKQCSQIQEYTANHETCGTEAHKTAFLYHQHFIQSFRLNFS